MSKWGFRKENCIFRFFLFYVGKIETEKRKKKWIKAKKTYKNRFFKVVIQKCEKAKKWIFSKNCLTLFVSGREKKRAFSCALSVLANFFWTKTVQTRKNYKNSGFSGNCPKPKMTPFLWKRCFLTWVKKWVLLTVFLKSCVFFSAKHSFSKAKMVCWKKQKILKNSGLFLNMANFFFWGLFFDVLMLLWFVLVCLA